MESILDLLIDLFSSAVASILVFIARWGAYLL